MNQEITTSPRGDLAGPRQQGDVAATSEVAAILQVIARAAENPAVDVEKMERLLAMQERMMDRQAGIDFSQALQRLQQKLPVIQRTKKGHNNKYASYDDIQQQIQPAMFEEGFCLSFRQEPSTLPGHLRIVGTLKHSGGHSEQGGMDLPVDKSGSMNPIQGVGSTFAYGQRYVAKGLLDLKFADEDDDGAAAGFISAREVNVLIDLMKQSSMDVDAESRFKSHMKVKVLSDIQRKDYPQAVYLLQAMVNKRMKAAAAPDGPPANLPDHKEWPETLGSETFIKVAGRVYRWAEEHGSYRPWEVKS